MKILAAALILCLLFLSTESSYSQVTGLLVNGSPTSFSVASGDLMTWSYNIPAGETALGILWLDLDVNHTIDPGIDRKILTFTQTDGDTSGNHGPPDMDGMVNGSVELTMPLGLAPQNYILSLTHGGVGPGVWGTVDPLVSPAYTISGTLTGPVGFDLRYRVVEASASGDNDVVFWNGLTDSLGNYTIEMGPDTTGNPWQIGMFNMPPPWVLARTDTSVTIDGNKTGINFTVLAPAAHVFGYLRDDAGDPLPFGEVYISRIDTFGGNISHWMQTDETGRFWLGIPLGELNGNDWRLGTPSENNEPTSAFLSGRAMAPNLSEGDSIARDLRIYAVNSTISGFLQVDGAPPGIQARVYAMNSDSGEAWAWSDGLTGSFTIPVSDKIADYTMGVHDYLGPYFIPNVVAQAGDTGVIFNLTTTGIGDEAGTLPEGYSLGQNYPNPFNPSTTIPYELPSAGRVVMKLYDALGREAAVLVNEEQNPGSKTLTFDAAGLPSGVYHYRITAGTFTAAKKLLIIR
jgi:hypothetical protein